MKSVFMFSGQGSQYYRMGESIFEHYDVFHQTMLRLDRVLQNVSGRSVVEALYDAQRRKSDPFLCTNLTHPAIFMVELALAETLIDLGVTPDATLGASLGFYTAAVVAGGISAEEALTAIVRQAELFDQTCQKGSMIAVLSSASIYSQTGMEKLCDLAAVNYQSHFVVSTIQDNIEPLELLLQKTNVTYVKLPISVAFHSSWIDRARPSVEASLSKMTFGPLELPIHCCASAGIVDKLSVGHFWRVARRPILFQDTIDAMEDCNAYRYIDVGPSGTLATFLKYILPATTRSTVETILSPMGSDLQRLASVIGKK